MIDFANAKSIVVPEGEVAVIARGDEILWRKLPYKRELAYLESTGTQHIDTGVTLTQNHKAELLVSHLGQSKTQIIFGSRMSAAEHNFGIVIGASNNLVVDFYDYTRNRLSYIITGDELIEISISKEKLKINNSEKAVSTYGNFATPETAYLFNGSGSYPAGYTPAQMRLYYCKIYNNDTLVRDFIPVLDWNGRPCMYDKVTDELFYNQGTGEFLYAL